ncbi:MAG: GNAT family N-acetyltransferase [Bacteroidales bacterium]|nr:GNAT family N-acetyltransferase [Bacteroidales bacterium]
MTDDFLHIRDYQTGDFIQVEKLWIETGMGNSERGDDERAISRTLKDEGKLLILENKNTGEIIGTSWLTSDGRRIYLHHFGIKPEYQGKGYAKFLLIKSLDHAKKTGLQIKLEVHQTNEIAISLYQKAGFKNLGDYEVYIIRKYEGLPEL